MERVGQFYMRQTEQKTATTSTAQSVQDDLSELTILRPRIDTSPVASIHIKTDYFNVLVSTEKDRVSKKRVIIACTVLYGLAMGNIWRFPKLMILNGKAAFVYLYILFMLTFGTSLLLFETTLGQYSTTGFAKVFYICPLFAGISYSMCAYCVIVTMFYNCLNVHNFHYLVHAIAYQLPVTPNVTDTVYFTSPEEEFYIRNVLEVTTRKGISYFSYANVAILSLIWGIITIALITGFLKTKISIYSILGITLCGFLLLFITTVVCFKDNAAAALALMFVPAEEDILNVYTWIFAFEQMVVSIGIGIGPLIMTGSFISYRIPAHITCWYVCVITLSVTILFGITIVFGIIARAAEDGVSIEEYLEMENEFDSSIHIIICMLIKRFPKHLNIIVMGVFYFGLFFTNIFFATECTKIVTVTLYDLLFYKFKNKVVTLLITLLVSFLLGVILIPVKVAKLVLALDKIFIGVPVMIILVCEFVAIGYMYSIYQLCDDIEFMLGYIPNMWYQLSWLILPFIIFAFTCLNIYAKITLYVGLTDTLIYVMLIILIVLPILILGCQNIYRAYKEKNLWSIFGRRQSLDFDNLSSGSTVSRFFRDLQKGMIYPTKSSVHGPVTAN